MLDALTSSRDLWTKALSKTPYAQTSSSQSDLSQGAEAAAAGVGPASVASISSAGRLEATLQDIDKTLETAGRALGLTPGTDGSIDFSGSLRDATRQLGDQLNGILARNRIPVDGPIDVYRAADGSLKVRGTPRMKDLIEKAINEDSSFRENFGKTESMAKLQALAKVSAAAKRWIKAHPEKKDEIEKWLERTADSIKASTFSLQVSSGGTTGGLTTEGGAALGFDQPGGLGIPFE